MVFSTKSSNRNCTPKEKCIPLHKTKTKKH